jgi:small subunit ribosomal protein S16
MLIIRYRRIGKKNHAQYKIVVAEKSFPVKGRFVEALGSYDPHNKETVLKEDKIKYWLDNGAQCSDSVHNLLVSKGIIKGEKRKVNIKTKEEAKEAEGEISEEDNKEVKEGEVDKEEKKEEAPTEEKKEEKKEEVKEETKPEEAEEQGKEKTDVAEAKADEEEKK